MVQTHSFPKAFGKGFYETGNEKRNIWVHHDDDQL
jgi:hypothetical protein